MATSISAEIIRCLKLFNQIGAEIRRPGYSYEGVLSSTTWSDELGRLRVWAANIGAHQTGQSSLDFRLRDASHIKDQVLSLLADLLEVVGGLTEEISKHETDHVPGDDRSNIESESSPTSEIQQLYSEVVNIIDCLYQLSMIIRKPAQHHAPFKMYMTDMRQYEAHDKDHARNKYGNVNMAITERLGRANTRRRQILLYRERHHEKLAKSIEEVQGLPEAKSENALSDTVATDLDTTHIHFSETGSDTGGSETSYAASLISGGTLTVPELPRGWEDGKPLQCPYCFFFINVNGIRSWTKHIFRDLKPYVCIYRGCDTPEKLYDTRSQWFQHLHESHQIMVDSLMCPLCKEFQQSLKYFERHLARHLEELALFVLPQSDSNKVDVGFGNETDSSSREDVRFLQSGEDVADNTKKIIDPELTEDMKQDRLKRIRLLPDSLRRFRAPPLEKVKKVFSGRKSSRHSDKDSPSLDAESFVEDVSSPGERPPEYETSRVLSPSGFNRQRVSVRREIDFGSHKDNQDEPLTELFTDSTKKAVQGPAWRCHICRSGPQGFQTPSCTGTTSRIICGHVRCSLCTIIK